MNDREEVSQRVMVEQDADYNHAAQSLPARTIVETASTNSYICRSANPAIASLMLEME